VGGLFNSSCARGDLSARARLTSAVALINEVEPKPALTGGFFFADKQDAVIRDDYAPFEFFGETQGN
jgi:hypothetical protein